LSWIAQINLQIFLKIIIQQKKQLKKFIAKNLIAHSSGISSIKKMLSCYQVTKPSLIFLLGQVNEMWSNLPFITAVVWRPLNNPVVHIDSKSNTFFFNKNQVINSKYKTLNYMYVSRRLAQHKKFKYIIKQKANQK
jgi:hypothetical protein